MKTAKCFYSPNSTTTFIASTVIFVPITLYVTWLYRPPPFLPLHSWHIFSEHPVYTYGISIWNNILVVGECQSWLNSYLGYVSGTFAIRANSLNIRNPDSIQPDTILSHSSAALLNYKYRLKICLQIPDIDSILFCIVLAMYTIFFYNFAINKKKSVFWKGVKNFSCYNLQQIDLMLVIVWN